MRGRILLAAGVVSAVVLAALTPARAASVAAVGWWSDRPGASAPEGGVLVGTGVQGPTAVAAVRIDLGDGVRSARLELTEVGGVAEGTAALAICVTGNLWEAGGGGPLEEAPTTSCTGAAVAPARVDGSWTADVLPLVDGRQGTVSLAVVPASAQGLWELQFEAPVLTATPVAAERPTTTTTAGATAAPGPSTPASPRASTFAAPGPAAVPVPSATTPAGDTADTADTAGDAAEPAAGSAGAGSEQAAGFQPLVSGTAAGADDGPTAGKVLLFAAVAAAVGIAAGVGRKYTTAP